MPRQYKQIHFVLGQIIYYILYIIYYILYIIYLTVYSRSIFKGKSA